MKVRLTDGLDVISAGPGGAVAHGDAATRLLAGGMRVNGLRTLATLRKEEWVQFDEAVLTAARSRLIGVADLQSRRLTHDIKNGLGTTILEYEDVSEMTPAELNMDGVTRGRDDRVEYSLKYLPLPLAHKSFKINIRVLNASRTRGESLDTTQAEVASRTVAELQEGLLFHGYNSFTYGGGILYGYCDFPSRIGYPIGIPWTAATGEQILADVIDMKQASINRKHYGPWVLYIPTNSETVLDNDFKANSDKPLRQRILDLQGIEAIKVADHLQAHNVVLVEMKKETIRWVNGLPFTNVEWQSEGNMIFHFKVMAIGVPQPRADQEGNCGIVHGVYTAESS
jgi:hypothetical protein